MFYGLGGIIILGFGQVGLGCKGIKGPVDFVLGFKSSKIKRTKIVKF